MVVITPPIIHNKELSLSNEMLERGLPLLHVRKPDFSFEQLQKWVNKISYQHHHRLVIHIPSHVINNNHEVFKQYLELINNLDAKYVHLSTINSSFVNNYVLKLPYLSTSVHNSTEYTKLSTHHQRVFLSPVYTSISKTNYHPSVDWQQEIQHWPFPWIYPVALGGITPDRLPSIHTMGFRDFALCGALWQSLDPLKIFDLCHKQDQLLFQ